MNNTLRALFIITTITLFGILAGCGSNGSNSLPLGTQETGKIALKLVWDSDSEVKSTAKEVFSAPNGVVTVRVKVAAPDITTTIQYDFAAGTGSGTIDGVLAGSGRTLTAQGLDSAGNVIYQGTATNITVLAGQITSVGPVTMSPPPTSSFTFIPSVPVVGQAIAFTDASTGSPTAWSWDFGDGTNSTTQNPSHAYSASGSFTVALTTTNATGSNTKSQSVTVSPNTYSIAGKITQYGTGLSGVTVALTSGQTATTDSSGNYSLTGIVNGSYTLTPTLNGYSFTPTTLAVTVSSANVTGKNFTATNSGSITVTW